jgi:hypothetical protein
MRTPRPRSFVLLDMPEERTQSQALMEPLRDFEICMVPREVWSRALVLPD